MDFFRLSTQQRKVFYLIFLTCVTLANIKLKSYSNINFSINQFAMALFVIIGFFQIKTISKNSKIAYLVFLLLTIIGVVIGLHNVWLISDLFKLLFLGTIAFIFVNLFETEAEFRFFVIAAALFFVGTVIVSLPTALHQLSILNRLVIPNFGKGGEDLGWSASVLYILMLSVAYKKNAKVTVAGNILLIVTMTILLLTMSRDAVFTVLIYGVLTKRWRMLGDLMVGGFISLSLIFYFFEAHLVDPRTFLTLNLYRYVPFAPGSWIQKIASYFKSAQNEWGPMYHHGQQLTPQLQNAMANAADKTYARVHANELPTYNQNWILTGRSLIWASFIKYYMNSSWIHKLFGLGIGSVTLHVKIADFNARDPHNIFLDILMNYGLVGLLVFMYGLVIAFVTFARNHSQESIAILCAILGSGLFNGLWRYSMVLWLTGLMMVSPFLYFRLMKVK